MSQSYATVRRFPDAPPLSPDNPGTLTPAQLGLLPGALPGRGGPDVVHPFVAARGSLARGTLPVGAAGAAVASLVNGLPFGGAGPGRGPAEPGGSPMHVGADPMAPPAFVAPPAAVSDLVGTATGLPAEPPKVVRATVDLTTAAREAGLVPVPPPIVQAPPPGLLASPSGAEASGASAEPKAPSPSPGVLGSMGAVGMQAEPAAPPAVVAPPPVVEPARLGADPAPPPMVGGPVAHVEPVADGGGSEANTLDSPWLKAPPPAPIAAPVPVAEGPAVVVAAPIAHAPPRSRTWIVAVVAVLILVAGAVAVLSTRSVRPVDDAPLKMDAPTSSPRIKGADALEPTAEPDATAEPARPVGTGLPPVGPAPTAPPGGYPQGPRPKPTTTATNTGGAAKPPPTATAPKFDPSTI